MLVRMRPLVCLATALGASLLACTAAGPSDAAGNRPALAPAVAPSPAPASAPVPVPVPVASVRDPAVPSPVAVPADDCGLRATIAAARDRDGTAQYTLTLKNTGTVARTLVTPGDGSEDGRRTPMLAWSGTLDGKLAPQLERPACGMMNAIEAGEIFTLEPGASRAMSAWIHGPVYGPGRYEVQLRYTNDPAEAGAADASPEVAALLAKTSACDVTSAPLAIHVP